MTPDESYEIDKARPGWPKLSERERYTLAFIAGTQSGQGEELDDVKAELNRNEGGLTA